MHKHNKVGIALLASLSLLAGAASGQELTGWHILSTAHTAHETGASISQADYVSDHWIFPDPTRTSSTVMGVLAQTDARGDTVLFQGENLRTVDTAPFNVSWWYRSLFTLPSDYEAGDYVRLILKGVNYRADVWVDGTQVASESDIVGVFRWFELDITQALSQQSSSSQQQHCVALRIHRSYGMWGSGLNETELGFTFVDWNPEPADSSMGLLMPVEVACSHGPVSLAHPMVNVAALYGTAPAYSAADLDAAIVARNWDLTSAASGVVRVEVAGAAAEVAVTIPANGTLSVVLRAAEHSGLRVSAPQLWWPYQMGEQTMHAAKFTFVSSGSGRVSDAVERDVGLRRAEGVLDENGHRLFRINGLPIVIRGAGFTPDLFARNNATRRAQELAYVRDMNLNAVRLEGKFEEEEFYDIADRLGLLVLDGWCCGDSWERWKKWQPETYWVAAESLRSQMRRLRAHASVVAFLIGSDFHPTPDVERMYLQVAEDEGWPVAVLSSATATPSEVSGPTGVKMSGPYSWVPPNYWLTDYKQQWGGAWGFLTEGGPGENPMLPESIRRTLPRDKWWPINSAWKYHCGNERSRFGTLEYFTEPLAARYGAFDASLEEFSRRAVAAVYESHRASFEAYQFARYTATGYIHWMLNNAWPSNIWHLYDYYLTPDSAYFAAKKAGEPIHAMFNYANRTVWVVNNRYAPAKDALVATAAVHDVTGKLAYKLTDVLPEGVAADSNTPLFGGAQLKAMGDGVPYFLSISLRSMASGKLVSRNVYWLLDTMDVLDWDSSSWSSTPVTKYADFSALGTMPAPEKIAYNYTVAEFTEEDGTGVEKVRVTVNVENPSGAIAFLLRARVLKGAEDKDDVLPIIWSDNFITLMPGESDVLTATFEKRLLEGTQPFVVIRGFNY